MSRMLLGSLVLVVAVAALPAPAAAQTDCLAANAVPHGVAKEPLADLKPLVPCYNGKAEEEFKRQLVKLLTDAAQEQREAELAVNNVEYMVIAKESGTCNDRDHSNETGRRAQIVLNKLLPAARKYLDAMGADFFLMKRAAAFAPQNKDFQKRLKTQIDVLDKAIDSLSQLNTFIEASAKQLQKLACDDAIAGAELESQQLANVMKNVREARDEISRLLVEFDRDPCKDFAKQVAPMKASQIDRAAGGGGTQLGAAGDLGVLAPRRLRLLADGTVLPLTLTAHADGFIRIDLKRGATEVTGVSGLMHRGSAGLRITVPPGASRGPAKLRVVFVSSHRTTTVATLSIQIV